MTRDEAIQEQIDECMDSFDFELCVEILELLKKRGRSYPEDWFFDGRFMAAPIRQCARKLLRKVAHTGGEQSYAMLSYLRAEKQEMTDEGGAWIRLYLSFVPAENLAQDGTGYETNSPETQEAAEPNVGKEEA